MNSRPPLSELLADPAGMVLRTDLLRAGWPERAVDALFKRRGRRLPGYSRPFVLAADVAITQVISAVDCASPHPVDGVSAAMSSTAATTLPSGLPGTAYIVARGEGPSRRFLVRFKLGGRESKIEYAGSFRRKSDAVLRRNFIITLIAAGLGSEIRQRLRSTDSPNGAVTVQTAAERWQASRVDVAAGTAQTYKVALARILPASATRRSRRSTSPPSPTSWPSCRG